jgi:hypothetical protein
MFFQSKLFKFLLPFVAYLLFAFLWAYNYMAVWYSNIPEETQYLRGRNMGFYAGYGYLILFSFLLFLVFGIIYLVKSSVEKYIRYILIAILFLSAYFLWHYSISYKGYQFSSILSFVDLVLFGFSIFNFAKKE